MEDSMAGRPRTVSDATVRAVAEYAGLDLPEERVPLLREQIENVLNFAQQWEQELDMLNTRPAHLYRIPWEAPDILNGVKR
jgi:Asp-tRNA(Asn)/Glu-tRNA(Gln) amidotransferase C subunit